MLIKLLKWKTKPVYIFIGSLRGILYAALLLKAEGKKNPAYVNKLQEGVIHSCEIN